MGVSATWLSKHAQAELQTCCSHFASYKERMDSRCRNKTSMKYRQKWSVVLQYDEINSTHLTNQEVTLNATIHGFHVQLMQVACSAILSQGSLYIPLKQGLVACFYCILRAPRCSLTGSPHKGRAQLKDAAVLA